MSEFEDAVEMERRRISNKEASERAVELDRQQAAAEARRRASSHEGTDPRLYLGEDTEFALDFIRTMRKHGMPGAKAVFDRAPRYRPSFFERVILQMETKDGNPLRGYLIGVQNLIRRGGPDYDSIKDPVYLCEDELLRTGQGSPLVLSTLHVGKFYTGTQSVESNRSGTREVLFEGFHELPLHLLLPEIAVANLGSK